MRFRLLRYDIPVPVVFERFFLLIRFHFENVNGKFFMMFWFSLFIKIK
jgi:hypothetical protein